MGNYYGAEFQKRQKSRMISMMFVSIAMMGVVAYEGWRIHASVDAVLLVIGVFAAWFVLALCSYLLAARKLRVLENEGEK